MDKDYRLPRASDPEFAGPVVDDSLERRRLERALREAQVAPEFVYSEASPA